MKEKFYFIKTYGCQMNVHESEKLAGMLKALNYTETLEMEKADVIVFNTCCIRDGCEQKVFGNLGSLKTLKKKNKDLIIAICGCLTQADGRKEFIQKRFPYVNIVFGTHNIHEFKKYLTDYQLNKKNLYEVWDKEKEINENVEMYRTSNNNAWVNIMYGCNNFCSYCIVPFVRGRERSRDIEDIVNEVKQLIKEGYKYITLLGQNVNSYGNDLNNPNITFAKLLETLAKLDGDFRIKFMTSHPKDLTDEVINVIANNEKLAKVIHLPVQSGNNKVLKDMNRKYTREHYLNLIEKVRKIMPDCYISTDIIVGFPGETEQEFEDTFSLIEKVRYDGVFAFMFSPRTGTVAEKMENQIPLDVKRKRVNKLLTLSKGITKEKTKECLNKAFNVLLEQATNENTYEGFTDSGKTVKVLSQIPVEINKFYNVTITSVTGNMLIGKIVD